MRSGAVGLGRAYVSGGSCKKKGAREKKKRGEGQIIKIEPLQILGASLRSSSPFKRKGLDEKSAIAGGEGTLRNEKEKNRKG